MKAFTAWAVAGATAVVGAGAFAVPAVAGGHSSGQGPGHRHSHVLRFTATAQRSANFSKTSFGQNEIDRNKAGRIIGFDVINGVFDPTSNSAHGWVALSTRGGLLYGSLNFSNGPVTTGRVTGGTGRFHGVTGTIYGHNLNASGTRTAVTVRYHY